jgi:predicted nuclease of predicted toxin-antitoxin system
VRLLVDANLSPSLIAGLVEAGFEALHVGDVDLLTASDAAIIDYGRANDLVVVTVDSDFAAALAIAGAAQPSVVQLRDVGELTPSAHLALLTANLGTVVEDLEAGAIVSLSPTRVAHHPVDRRSPTPPPSEPVPSDLRVVSGAWQRHARQPLVGKARSWRGRGR